VEIADFVIVENKHVLRSLDIVFQGQYLLRLRINSDPCYKQRFGKIAGGELSCIR